MVAQDRLEILRVFLLEHVFSFEQLESVLLLLQRGSTGVTPEEVAAASALSVDAADVALAELAAQGDLVVQMQQSGVTLYRYEPKFTDADRFLAELASLYRQQPIVIIRMMSQNALERVRGAAARRLADAFRLDRGKK